MSDMPQGPGWWQASDGRWYPPESAPGVAPASGAGYGAAAYGPLAEWGTRAAGLLIDLGLLVGLFVAGLIVAGIVTAVVRPLGALLFLVVYLGYIAGGFYLPYLVGRNGASPGMKLMGIRCISEQTGQPIGGGMGILRSIAHILDSIICYIGWLFPLWDTKKQTIADKLVGTIVLSGQPKASFGPDLFKP